MAALLLIGLAALGAAALAKLGDAELLKRYAEGDAVAFDVIFERYEKRILFFVLRSVRDRERAEELTQEVFIRVVRSASGFRPTRSFKAWVFAIARNICVDESRRQVHRQTDSLNESPTQDSSDNRQRQDVIVDVAADAGAEQLVRAEFRRAVLAALDDLPDEQRNAFVLRVSEGLKFREIAEQEGVSENTIKSRVRYALDSLRESLASFDGYSFDDESLSIVAPDRPERQV